MLRGQPQSRAPCVRITPVVALECATDSPSGECGAQSVDRGKPWDSHAECETHARWWFGGEMCLFPEVAAQPRCWRQLQYSLIGAGITPVVVPGCVTLPLRGQRSGSGALESPPGLPRSARIKDLRLSWPGCVLRVLRNLQSGSEPWTHSPVLPRPVRQSAVRNPRITPPLRERNEPGVECMPCRSGLFREACCDPVHHDRRPDLLREVWTMRRVDASLRTGHPSGGAVQRLSADGNQVRRKTNAVPSCKRQPATPTAATGTLRVHRPPHRNGAVDNVRGPGSP